MIYYQRTIEKKLKENLFQGKVVIVYGARQVGKTTLMRQLQGQYPPDITIYLNADNQDIQDQFNRATNQVALKDIIGAHKLVIIDEAQKIDKIGLKLKILVDSYPDQQIIATGSSSFELASGITEPLTGRNIQFWLYPLSLSEIAMFTSPTDIRRKLEPFLIYGMYPGVIKNSSTEEKTRDLKTIAQNYLYKDILSFGGLRKPLALRKLVQALALQIGGEVSYNELGVLIGASKETVMSYIDILEKAFIVFRLTPFSRNLRKELGKLNKIYFYDIGVRNAVINNLNPLHLRDDKGALWENFCIAEFKKRENYIADLTKYHFWRTYDQKEIDLIEEKEGRLSAWEIKWQGEIKKSVRREFLNAYVNAELKTINNQNYMDFLLS